MLGVQVVEKCAAKNSCTKSNLSSGAASIPNRLILPTADWGIPNSGFFESRENEGIHEGGDAVEIEVKNKP
jgi:hypothetical protein